MITLMQDLRYALRQLRKTPAFTLTAILTLALGIGANAAIFTLVHAVILQGLPVTNPETLIRIGDRNQCCVNSGARDDGNYALFPTETYEQIKKNVPEFEELAALQAALPIAPSSPVATAARRPPGPSWVNSSQATTFAPLV